MSHTIKQINADFESMNKRATDLGLQRILFKAPAHVHASSDQTGPFFIGRDDDVSKLVYTLTHLPEDRIFFMVALVGMGGMGKTTLARKVFNDERVKNQFGSLIWVNVSQTFDPISIFSKILLSLTTSDGVDSKEDILKNLHEALKSKTYLLVLDDVWNEDIPTWEDFLNSIVGVTSSEGNGIIITTRSQKVASIVDPFEVQILNELSDDDCWSIIKARTFDRNEEAPLEFETIGRKIAKGCHGLPLAANVVGNVLNRKSKEEWRFISESWLSDDKNDFNITKILRMSYDQLSSPSLKECFAYCSVFPEGRDIPKQELIELWMAEGFFQPNRIDDMESVGNMFLNILLQGSLLQVAEKDDHGNISSFVMHELVRDLASSVLSNNLDESTRMRYMFLKEESSPISKERAQHLRILECEKSDTMFSDFKCLHNLTLSGDHYKELPNSIRELISLRRLNISNTRIGYLPEWIDKLHYLQTLRVCKSPLERPILPSTLSYLWNLRHLYITWNTELPADIGRLTCLRTLTHFRVGKDKGYRIEELGSLKHLKGKLEISNLEKVCDKKEALKANIFEKSNLSELVLKWEVGREGERNDEAVLEGLQPHSNETLNKLTISGFQGKRFPSWTENEAVGRLEGLIEITLSSCQQCKEIPALGHLPNLKFLSLSMLSNVRSINPSFYGTGSSDRVIFPALESISLLNMAELSEWTQIEFTNAVIFPRLQSLKMHHCDKLELIPIWLFHNTDSLWELDIRHCPKLRKVPNGVQFSNEGNVIPGLQSLKVYHCYGLECVPNILFHNTHSLSELDIRHCPMMRKLSDGLHGMDEQEIELANDVKVFPALKSLKMHHCYKLESLPDCLFCNTHSLSELDIRHCPMLKELPAIGQHALDSLEQMTIRGCRNLKSIAHPSSIPSYASIVWRFVIAKSWWKWWSH
ncbi:putative disease resistance protein RGA3 [Salvia hispanica]|uniref:putative disease resistance protein RGA3 n=1 Tax=Salvia hispanica TaxID=49212 RepID=UPI0020094EBD|nr:putative disease resistance protein RGA3 [Salvia hispanica]